jgi:hypothetical protein
MWLIELIKIKYITYFCFFRYEKRPEIVEDELFLGGVESEV